MIEKLIKSLSKDRKKIEMMEEVHESILKQKSISSDFFQINAIKSMVKLCENRAFVL